jgi:mono/diheme cytochrome c family protein
VSLLLVPATLIFVLAAAIAAQEGARSTRDGVFTEAQAARGKTVFDGSCIECHGAEMWGSDWEGKSVADAYDFIKQFMPEYAPGSLTPEQTRDVLAFILQSNKLPAGATDLPESAEGMKAIRLEGAAR